MSGAVNLTASATSILASAAGGHEGETLVRVRGLCQAVLESAVGLGDGYFGAIGMGVFTTAAITAGTASIPTPLTEAGWDGWFLHQYFSCHSGDAAVANGSGQQHLILDSKAMRKVNEDESVGLIVEVAETGTAVIDVLARVRILSMAG